MNYQVSQLKILFAKELQRRCSEKYHKFPSNEKLARDFCLSSRYSLKVSRETIRKWLKGDTFPDLDYLLHLIDWIGLDMSNIFLDIRIGKQLITTQPNIKNNSDSAGDLNPIEIDSVIKFFASLKKSEVMKQANPHKSVD